MYDRRACSATISVSTGGNGDCCTLRFARSPPFMTCLLCLSVFIFFFFFNDTATTEIYTLSLHDALPILAGGRHVDVIAEMFEDSPRHSPVDLGIVYHQDAGGGRTGGARVAPSGRGHGRSEEHTSELQSQFHLVCRLLLEKKKKKQ